MIVVGAGLVGLASAWLLQRRGHRVLLLDPGPAAATAAAGPAEPTAATGGDGPTASPETLAAGDGAAGGIAVRSGSGAALGLLMAQVFHRSSGRAWRLRQRSLALWSEWRQELEDRGRPLDWRPGLLLLASSPEELERQRRLVEQRRALGMPLELWERSRLETLDPLLPEGALAGLHSAADGQLDPGRAMEVLRQDALAAGLTLRRSRARALIPRGGADGRKGWRLELQEGDSLEGRWLVLAAGVESAALLEPLGLQRPLEPVLGQALELELEEPPPWSHWPGAVSWRGFHLVPRPQRAGGCGLWLGATLEPGQQATQAALAELRSLAGAAPPWLRRARLRQHWLGLRPRPLGRPAPLLEQLRPGLLLAAGHYRNGVLLAPVSAEWIRDQVEDSAAAPLTITA
ncbi:MAG: FAD-dependent oxidoreductase [Synechococcaceae cyanobacterium]|nr:FAD-dependent oxidoreductase [Synechococcaceae cyanobacterium]